MIIGKISENGERIRFSEEIHCTRCGKKVPGGLQTSRKYYRSKEFHLEMESFKKNYLCGICRDKKRRDKAKQD